MKTRVYLLNRVPGILRRTAVSVLAAALLPLAAAAAPAAKSGDGTMVVTPSALVAAGAGDRLAFAFRNANRGPFQAGSQLELTVPAGWTAPQAAAPGAPGYVSVTATGGVATASVASISGAGPWTIRVDFTAAKGTANGFELAFADAACSVAGTHVFAVRTRQAGGALVAIGSSPAITVTPAPAAVTLGGLVQVYDGTPRAVTVETDPAGLAVAVTYDGEPDAPTAVGAYAVAATVTEPGYSGTASGTLVVQAAGGGEPTFGRETFDFFTHTGSVYASGTFLGQDGSAWAYAKARGDLSLSGRSPTLEKAKGAFLRSGTIPGGVGTISLTYRKAGTQNVNCGVFVNGVQIGTVSGGNGVVYSWTSGVVNVAGDVVLMLTNDVNAGAITLDDVEWTGYRAPATVVLGGLEQVYDGTPRAATATTDPEGLAVAITYDGAEQVPTQAGTYAVAATIVDGLHAGSASGTLVVARAGQTIDFPALADPPLGGSVTLAATASSGLPVDFSVVEGPAVLEGVRLSFTGTGRVAVAAAQAGDGNWNPAPAVVRAFTVFRPPCQPEVSVASVNVREGGEGRFFVRLDRAPEETVAVAVDRAEGAEGLTVKTGTVLTFGPQNWSWWQAVTLAAAEDDNADGETAVFRIAAPGAPDQFVTATVLDGDIGENLASAASGSEITGAGAFRCAQSTDGISDSPANYGYTVWTNASPGAMTLNLKALTQVSRIRLLNWDWLYPVVHRYRIESSLDGVEWAVLVDASEHDRSGWDDWPVGGQPARYLRFVGLSNSANAAVCIPEWEVYGERAPLPQPVLSRPTVHVHEMGIGHFFVRLDRAPEQGEVAVSVTRHNGGTADLQVVDGALLTFDAANWDQWQKVALAANEDVNAENETGSFQISAPGVPAQWIAATVLDDDIGENLALASSGTTISGQGAGQEGLVIDGEHRSSTNFGYTVWTSTPPGTLTMDLQAPSTLSRVRLFSWNWEPHAQQYRIEASLDGTNWTLLANACEQGRCGWEDWDAAGLRARYLRFTGLSNSADDRVRIAEWEVYGVRVPPPRPEMASKRIHVREAGEGRVFVRLNSAPEGNATVTLEHHAGAAAVAVRSGAVLNFTPANWNIWQVATLAAPDDENDAGETAVFKVSMPGAADQFIDVTVLDDDIGVNLALASGGATIKGKMASQPGLLIDGIHAASANYGYTIWTNNPPGTITLDLKSVQAVARVRVLLWDWVYRVQTYRLEASADGTNWAVVADASMGDHQGWEDWDLAGAAFRYLRFTGLSSSANQAVLVSELEVYGVRPEAPAPAAARKAPAVRAFPAGSAEEESLPLRVLTSNGADDESGWAALDGDPETAWAGQKAGGGYLLIEFDPEMELSAVEVDMAAGSLAGVQFLSSREATDWQPLPDDLDRHPVELRYLWLVFPDDGTEAVPQVQEIRFNP